MIIFFKDNGVEHDEAADGSYGSCGCAECIALDRIIDEEGYGYCA